MFTKGGLYDVGASNARPHQRTCMQLGQDYIKAVQNHQPSRAGEAMGELIEYSYFSLLSPLLAKDGKTSPAELYDALSVLGRRVWDLAHEAHLHRFACILWAALEDQVADSARIAFARPRFMLRQFVDELKLGAPRNALERFVYGLPLVDNLSEQDVSDLRTGFDELYVAMNHVGWPFGRESTVKKVTCDVIILSTLKEMAPENRRLQFQQWLLGTRGMKQTK